MKFISIEITRVVDDSVFPHLVQALLVDAQGHAHWFVEKDAILSSTPIAVNELPRQGLLACEVLLQWVDLAGRSLVRASTMKPWGVESTAGSSDFVVLAEQLKVV